MIEDRIEIEEDVTSFLEIMLKEGERYPDMSENEYNAKKLLIELKIRSGKRAYSSLISNRGLDNILVFHLDELQFQLLEIGVQGSLLSLIEDRDKSVTFSYLEKPVNIREMYFKISKKYDSEADLPKSEIEPEIGEIRLMMDYIAKDLKEEFWKCPSCRSTLQKDSRKCKDCGYEIKNTDFDKIISPSAKKLVKIFGITKEEALRLLSYVLGTFTDTD